MKLIGEILIDNGLLAKKDLAAALEKQKTMKHRKPLGEILILMGFINITTLLEYLDMQLEKREP